MFSRRSGGAVVAAAFAVVLAGCTNYVGESEHQARLEVADYSGWVRAKSDARDETLREIGQVKVGRLKQGDEATLPLEVTGAHKAVVIAACDERCSDLDLRVVTDDGRLIGLDEGDDDYPQFTMLTRNLSELVLPASMCTCG